jgi:RNA polymerase sigma factor (sigma-70 family)
MASDQASTVIRCLRGMAWGRRDDVGDGELLDAYVRQKDEAAFEALVRRHGPMVLAVCRRTLGNVEDADDAFQATFLVLVRKAACVRPPGLVGNWLYGVAQRTALAARKAAARRRAKEARVTPRTATPEDPPASLRPLLDRELARLPDRYRAALVLCDLEGRTRKEAARLLGLPEGTVASRLDRARGLLARHLSRAGVALSAGALAAALARDAASAAVPPALLAATVRSATAYAAGSAAAGAVPAHVAALTEGMVNAMFLNRLKIAVVFLAVLAAAGIGVGGLSYGTPKGDRPALTVAPRQVAQAAGNGFQAARGRAEVPQDRRPEKTAPDPNVEAFLKAFQIASELARAKAKGQGGEKATDQDQAKQILDMVLKGFQAYQESKGRQGERPGKPGPELYEEAFLKGFQIASEMTRAKAKGQGKRPTGPDAFDISWAAFLKAYETAGALQKALDGKRREQISEALDQFLRAGKEFEQAGKRRVQTQAVQRVRREIADALSRVAETTHDRRAALETLAEIERVVREMQQQIREGVAPK